MSTAEERVLAGALRERAAERTVATMHADGAPRAERRLEWAPRQHGAWAMLAVPLLLGVIASRPSMWQLVLLVAAVAGYLASAAGLDWLRSRRSTYLHRAIVPGILFALAATALTVAFPILLGAAVILAPAGVALAWVSATGHPRSLIASLAQVAQAIVLVPAAAVVSGSADAATVGRATLVAALYLAGSVLVVRSMIRERGDPRFHGVSVGYHVAAIVVQAWLLPWAYAALAVAFAVRAAGLPLLQSRLADGPRRLRPIHLGLVEMACSVALVLVALFVRF